MNLPDDWQHDHEFGEGAKPGWPATANSTRVDDLRIAAVRPLISPALLQDQLPMPEAAQALVERARARTLLLELAALGLPADTEFLDLLSPQYIADLVCRVAIGARTTASQSHRQLASGLSCPVGFKNGTDGGVQCVANAIVAASSPHAFMGMTKMGQAASCETRGNADCHVILRGGRAPNYGAADVEATCAAQLAAGERCITSVMIESHLRAGRQDLVSSRALQPGVSITDACLGWDDSAALLNGLAQAVHQRRVAASRSRAPPLLHSACSCLIALLPESFSMSCRTQPMKHHPLRSPYSGSSSWPRVTVLLTSLFMGTCGALAGPVSGDDSAAADPAPLASPALATPDLGESLTATGVARAAAPVQADAAATPSALAVEIIKEAQAGAAAAEPTRPAPRPSAMPPAARAAPNPNADDDALRAWGKAAVMWVKQTIPWLRKDEEDEPKPPITGLGQTGWNDSPLDPGRVGRSGRSDAVPAIQTAAAPTGPDTSVGYGAAPRATYDPPTNLIREIIDIVRTVLEHPMTWLVGALVVIGAIAVKRLDRRPTK